MFAAYDTLTGIEVKYQAVGSGPGITAITNGTVDFGASDAIMTSAQVAAAQAASGPILAIPTTMGTMAISYDIPGLGNYQLKLTGTVLANIYLKNITYWDDPAIIALNPGASLPHTAIAVVHDLIPPVLRLFSLTIFLKLVHNGLTRRECNKR